MFLIMKKMVYFFGEAGEEKREILGNKGAQLGEMTRMGLPVPPGFTISAKVCSKFLKNGRFPEGLEREIRENLIRLERKAEKKFGDPENPLLVSIRSGSSVSMPGMMDTVLNLGLNERTLKGLIKKTDNERFAWDSYRRFIQMFGSVVFGINPKKFEGILDRYKKRRKDTDLTTEELKKIIENYKRLIKKETGKPFPSDPKDQLLLSISAIFRSWNNKRAKVYRRLNKIPDDVGTAVNIQAMVFGNMGWDSGTGVGFTRNPSTGEKDMYGEYLLNAQGEDVVAGVRTPLPIKELKNTLPDVYKELEGIYESLERHYKDMQDLEFTIEKGKLYILQTRNGKRTAKAAVKIAVDMVKEGLIDKKEAIMRIDPKNMKYLLYEKIDTEAKLKILAKGLAASPGVGIGRVVFDADDAVKMKKGGKKVILVRRETSAEDIHGMSVAEGVLTARGGITSHASVVARSMGKPCVVGCESIRVDEKNKKFIVNGREIEEGDFITLDGGLGYVILGKAPTKEPEISKEFGELMQWVDEIRRLGVRANADTEKDAKQAKKFGAEGIGLCRTEHMFFAKNRLPWMQRMILAETKEERKKCLEKLLVMQKEDFKRIFEVMEGLPVTIRLLDPPLHEFLPSHEETLLEIKRMKDKRTIREREKVLQRIEELMEVNPMMGNRGCRLGVTSPEIYEMQARAIFEAACELKKKKHDVIVEVMIPLVSNLNEFMRVKQVIDEVAEKVMKRFGINLNYSIGTMIELPRACLVADEIAKEAEFFSFGTNDLTQMVFGFSRDDAEGKFLKHYEEEGIILKNPFKTLDTKGVGELIKIAVKKGKKTRSNLKIGVCGEHGGETESILFFHKAGVDYISCSSFRVPVARLAAAQARIKTLKA
jgi:pyruvate,orthophosphate dikinase